MNSAEAARPALRLVDGEREDVADHDVLNLYAVIASEAAADVARACVEWDVRIVSRDDLAAVVAPAGAGFDRLRAHGSRSNGTDELDLGALGEVARRHEAVMEALLAVTSIVPFRIGTAVRTEADAEALLQRHTGRLREALGWVTDRAEWSVRVWSVSEAHGPAPEAGIGANRSPGAGSPAAAHGDEVSPGRRYLLERRSDRERTAEALRRRDKLAAAILSDLEPMAVGISFRPAGAGRPRANGGHPSIERAEVAGILDIVVLADRAADESIFGTVRRSILRLGVTSLRARVTGPWPPYHFVGEVGSRPGDEPGEWGER